MTKFLTLTVVAVLLSGCAQEVKGIPAKEPQKIDCDLIFPGPDQR